MPFALASLLGVLLLCTATGLRADPQSKAFSLWYVDGYSATVTYSIATSETSPIAELRPTLPPQQMMLQHLAASIRVQQGGIPCQLGAAGDIPSKPGYLRFQLRFNCSTPLQQPLITIGALFAYSAKHVHFARFNIQDGPAQEYLYTKTHPSHQLGNTDQSEQLSGRAGNWPVFSSYVLLGFEHILAGIDHIAFLLTLLLLANRVRDVLLIVTGFTLGHSITLSLAVLQLATPDPMAVEALIGFSIALVAAENVAAQTRSSAQVSIVAALLCASLAMAAGLSHRGPPVISMLGLALFCLCYLNLANSRARALQLRPVITTLFGLVHGFGFASVLMEVGLPRHSKLPALLGFNIGVELGQLAIVLVIALLALAGKRWLQAPAKALGSELLSAGLCGLGVFWLVQRGFYA